MHCYVACLFVSCLLCPCSRQTVPERQISFENFSHCHIERFFVFVSCLTSQQHASVSQGWICLDNFTCCHTEIEVADQTFYLTQSQYTDTGPTSPSTGPLSPGTWQGSHWSANFEVTGKTQPGKSRRKGDSNPEPSTFEADALTTRPTRHHIERDHK